jgi:predicted nucleotide-binding protein
VLTAEDETHEGRLRARQNVVHEAGLFQGKLGFTKVALILQNGVEDFSTFDSKETGSNRPFMNFSGP